MVIVDRFKFSVLTHVMELLIAMAIAAVSWRQLHKTATVLKECIVKTIFKLNAKKYSKQHIIMLIYL